jgi:putative alpha-1,2-mannosidase
MNPQQPLTTVSKCSPKPAEPSSQSTHQVCPPRLHLLAIADLRIQASRVGHLRFTFQNVSQPHIIVQATRNSVVSNNLSRIATNIGDITILPSRQEITGRNPERQDDILGPFTASHFAGYFVARFSTPFTSWGTATNATLHENETARTGEQVMGYFRFAENVTQVDVRVGVSFISVNQARANLDKEIPDGTSLEQTAFNTRSAWAEKLDRIQIEGGTNEQKTVFYTGFYHTLQYPYEVDEDGQYYSGYDDRVRLSLPSIFQY